MRHCLAPPPTPNRVGSPSRPPRPRAACWRPSRHLSGGNFFKQFLQFFAQVFEAFGHQPPQRSLVLVLDTLQLGPRVHRLCFGTTRALFPQDSPTGEIESGGIYLLLRANQFEQSSDVLVPNELQLELKRIADHWWQFGTPKPTPKILNTRGR